MTSPAVSSPDWNDLTILINQILSKLLGPLVLCATLGPEPALLTSFSMPLAFGCWTQFVSTSLYPVSSGLYAAGVGVWAKGSLSQALPHICPFRGDHGAPLG